MEQHHALAALRVSKITDSDGKSVLCDAVGNSDFQVTGRQEVIDGAKDLADR